MRIILLVLMLITSFVGSSQNAIRVADIQSDTFMTDEIRNAYNLHFPVVQIIHYTDKTGQYFCIFTESGDGTFDDKAVGGKKNFNKKIKAISLKKNDTDFQKQWELNDFVITNESEAGEELSIWFWNSYSIFKDLDADGMVDHIIVYGTRSNFNFTQNGRLKILLYYNGKKVGIRHQNGTLDEERKTVVDKSFYHLPKGIQNEVKSIMQKLENDGLSVFPHHWQNQMNEKKTILKENESQDFLLDVPALFEQAKKVKDFWINLEMNGVEKNAELIFPEKDIFYGDVNYDDAEDLLLPFTVKYTRADGRKYSDPFYALFINENGAFFWDTNFHREKIIQNGGLFTIQKIEAGVITGFFENASQSARSISLEWNPNERIFEKYFLNDYFWNYSDLKINGEFSLLANKKNIFSTFGKPDKTTQFYRDCNEGGGDKEILHYQSLRFEFNEDEILDNEIFNLDNNIDFSIHFKSVKLNKNTHVKSITKLSPQILNQQPFFNASSSKAKGIKEIYIPLRQKIQADEYYDLNWIILTFKNDQLWQITIPNINCDV